MSLPAFKSPVESGRDARALLLERLSSGTFELPIMPAMAAEVLAACRDERAGVERIVRLVSHDPALTAHVLRAANSAAFAASAPVTAPHQAISRVGLTTVTQIALAACVRGKVFQADRYKHLLDPVWPRSVMAAGWARQIALLKGRDADDAFLAGLLHDVGRPVIIQALVRIERETKHTFGDDQAAEAMDYLHPRVGGELARRWNMPESIASAIAWHHDPHEAVEHRADVFANSFAVSLAEWSLEGDAGDVAAACHRAFLDALEIGPDEVDRLLAQRESVVALAEGLI